MIDVLRNTVMITGFVFVMMLVIEYINILTRGVWQGKLARNPFGQYLIAALLGAVPGCLGVFAVVAMFSHRVIGFGAIVTAMIATSGDEAFVMLAMIPREALLIFAILFAVGILAGALTDMVAGRTGASKIFCCEGLVVHDGHEDDFSLKGKVVSQWKRCSGARGVLTIVRVGLIAAILTGQAEHGRHDGHLPPGGIAEQVEGDILDDHHPDAEHGGSGWGWVRLTMLVSSAIALFIVATVPDHFLEEHLWEHVAKEHLIKIFLWTFGALAFLHLITEYLHLDIESVAGGGRWLILAAACLVGVIPQSGPHLVFVTLFAQGMIPFSVLLANSIVQDGHGMLPLLAHSRKAFIMIKAVNIVVGFLAGAAAIVFFG